MANLTSDIQKTFTMFANDKKQLMFENILTSLQCAGYTVDMEFIHKHVLSTSIDYEEYKVLAIKAAENQLTRDRIESSFKTFDPEGTGYIKASEFKSILTHKDSGLSEADVKDIFEQFKPNEDGMICYNIILQYFYETLLN